MGYRYAKDANGNRVLFRSATDANGNKQWFPYDESKVPTGVLDKLNASTKSFGQRTLENLPGSIKRVGENTIEMVKHPIDSATALADVAAGGLLSIPGANKVSTLSPEDIAARKSAFGSYLDMFKNRYGGIDAIKNTVETDPAGAVLDAAAMASNLSALKTGAKIAGSVAANAAAPVVRKVIGQASPDIAALANYARQEGLRIPVDQILDSRVLSVPAKSLEYIPFSGRRETEAALHRQTNKAASALFNQPDTNFNRAIRKGSAYFDQKFDDILGNNNVNLSQNFLTNLANIQQEASQFPNPIAASNARVMVDRIVDLANNRGVIPGRQLYLLKQEVDNMAKRPPEFGGQLGSKLRDAIYSAYDESLPAGMSDDFRALRDEYSNFARLRKIGTNAVEGDINYRKLANLKPPFKPGLEEMAQIGAQFLAGKDKAGMMYGVIPGLTMTSLIAAGLPSHVVSMILAGRGFNSLLNSDTLRNIVLNNKIPIDASYAGNAGTNLSNLYDAIQSQQGQ